MNELISQKINLRKILTHKRYLIKKNSSIEFNSKIFEELNKYINFEEIQDIASFISIRSEISTDKLNKKIMELSKTLSFPVIKKNSKELIFKKSNPNNHFKLGKFNIPEPIVGNEETVPQLFFVPCLGFDLNGYRLGYGGGYYDKTISYYKSINHKFLAVGLAYDDQKVDNVVHDNFDQKLNYILTEKQLYKIL